MQNVSLVRAVLLISLVGTVVPQWAAAQQILLQPNWNDVAAQKYLVERAKGDFAPELPTERTASFAEFSLPVIGLMTGFSEAEPIDAVRDRFISSAPAVLLPWPSCATDQAKVTTARDQTGTWYTVNYDFGCLHVSINGDRNAEPGSADEAPVPDGAVEIGVDDEADDPTLVSQRSIAVNRFGLAYLVSLECNAEIKTFCQDPAAWPALISRFSILDGQP